MLAHLDEEIVVRVAEPVVVRLLIGPFAVFPTHVRGVTVTAERIVPADRVRRDGKQGASHVAHQHMAAGQLRGVLSLQGIRQVEAFRRGCGIPRHEGDGGSAFQIGETQRPVPSQHDRPKPASGQIFFVERIECFRHLYDE